MRLNDDQCHLLISFFSNKASFGNKIKFVENDELLQDDKNC